MAVFLWCLMALSNIVVWTLVARSSYEQGATTRLIASIVLLVIYSVILSLGVTGLYYRAK